MCIRDRYDHIHVQRAYCAPFALELIRRLPGSPLLTLDIDEDDASVYRKMAELMAAHDAVWPLAEAEAFAAAYAAALGEFAQLFVTSSSEQSTVAASYGVKAQVVENAIPLPKPIQRASGGPGSILFVGALDHPPNSDGISWFLEEVWPNFDPNDGWCVDLVGRGAPKTLATLAEAKGVSLHGWIDDLRPFYQKARVAILPLRFGGGTKLKLLEAVAHGVPVVTSSAGLEGLKLDPQNDLLLADKPAAFAEAIRAAAQDANGRSINAHAYVATYHDRAKVVTSLKREFSGARQETGANAQRSVGGLRYG